MRPMILQYKLRLNSINAQNAAFNFYRRLSTLTEIEGSCGTQHFL